MNHLASVEQGTSLVLDADVVKGPESHAEYMSEGNIKSPSDLVLSDNGVRLRKKLWDETEKVPKKQVLFTEGLNDIFKV